MALRAQADALKGQIESYDKETKALWQHLNSKTAEVEASSRQLAEERARADDLANRLVEFDRHLAAQTGVSVALRDRAQQLAARLHAQTRMMSGGETLSSDL